MKFKSEIVLTDENNNIVLRPNQNVVLIVQDNTEIKGKVIFIGDGNATIGQTVKINFADIKSIEVI